MNSTVGAVLDQQQDIPAYVRFEQRPVQDMSVKDRYAAKDVDFVIITPPYSKDEIIKKVSAWLEGLDAHVRNGRLRQDWADAYKAKYKAWKEGREEPLEGTAIKGWPVISPAQQATLIAMKVLTVEALAAMNDEGIRRYGMGGSDLKNKAIAWLSQAKDKGPLTMENARLKREVDTLTKSMKNLQGKLDAMIQQMQNGAAMDKPNAARAIDESFMIEP